jgi:hypothetical protein
LIKNRETGIAGRRHRRLVFSLEVLDGSGAAGFAAGICLLRRRASSLCAAVPALLIGEQQADTISSSEQEHGHGEKRRDYAAERHTPTVRASCPRCQLPASVLRSLGPVLASPAITVNPVGRYRVKNCAGNGSQIASVHYVGVACRCQWAVLAGCEPRMDCSGWSDTRARLRCCPPSEGEIVRGYVLFRIGTSEATRWSMPPSGSKETREEVHRQERTLAHEFGTARPAASPSCTRKVAMKTASNLIKRISLMKQSKWMLPATTALALIITLFGVTGCKPPHH